MRIAQVSTVGTRVGWRGAGSIESVVWLLCRELMARGHEVTLFATADSETDAELVPTTPGPYGKAGTPSDWQLCEWLTLSRAVAESSRFDVVHTHAYLWGISLEPLALCPMVHTLHTMPTRDQFHLTQLVPGACITGISQAQWAEFPQVQPAAMIHHGIDPALFTFRAEPSDYVCYLGRFAPSKGPLRAIEAARVAGLRLLLAGPENDYFRDIVMPHVDGRSVEYIGSVTGAERDDFLGGARALLYPLDAPEPFGLVPVEAMMCGTPVVATDGLKGHGAIGEIVEAGVTGYMADAPDQLVAALDAALLLERTGVRGRAEERFSSSRMAIEYLAVYGQLTGQARSREAPRCESPS